jgi:hypothetical protein
MHSSPNDCGRFRKARKCHATPHPLRLPVCLAVPLACLVSSAASTQIAPFLPSAETVDMPLRFRRHKFQAFLLQRDPLPSYRQPSHFSRSLAKCPQLYVSLYRKPLSKDGQSECLEANPLISEAATMDSALTKTN